MLAQATMPSTFRSAARSFALFTLLAAMVHGAAAAVSPSADDNAMLLQKRAGGYEGCYSSSTPLTSAGTNIYQSTGKCTETCAGSAVYAMTMGDACWCGDELPALSDKVDLSDCDTACVGFPNDICTCRWSYDEKLGWILMICRWKR